MLKNICENCGKEYEYEYKRGTCKTHYCSDKCKQEYMLKQAQNAPVCTKELLREMYIKENKTLKELAEYFHLTFKQVVHRLEKFGIKKSQKDVAKNRTKSMEEKYGVSCAASVPKFQEKLRQTNRQQYGVDYVFQNEEVKEKIRNTKLENKMKDDD